MKLPISYFVGMLGPWWPSGTWQVYPTVEPPPLANLPVPVADDGEPSAEQLQRLRAEVSGAWTAWQERIPRENNETKVHFV